MNTSRQATTSSSWQFVILVTVVMVTGLSQGMLLPLLTIFLERMNVPSDLNALHATAMYVGTFGMMFLVEFVLTKLGYKRMLLSGLLVVTIVLALFPLMPSIGIWFVLRIIVGAGNSALHYATQLWAVTISPEHRRGRNISLYGMAYGVGFSIGPFFINLLKISDQAPFIAIIVLFMIVTLIVWYKLPDRQAEAVHEVKQPAHRYRRSYSWAWFALLPSFLYGYMEASMNSNFPIYALRIGLEEQSVAFLLPFFGIGGLILQLPLGMLSDRISRKAVLISCGLLGGIGFCLIPYAGADPIMLIILFMIVGGLVGSFFSLGLAYAADILPKAYLPSANVIASMHFSLGSLIGPNIGGLAIQHVSLGSMFFILGALYIVFSASGLRFKGKKHVETERIA